jgi:hypothetical protein
VAQLLRETFGVAVGTAHGDLPLAHHHTATHVVHTAAASRGAVSRRRATSQVGRIHAREPSATVTEPTVDTDVGSVPPAIASAAARRNQ